MALIKLQKIDEFLITEYFSLDSNDCCYFFGEYAARCGYNYSTVNKVIINFKKPTERKNLAEWHYKEQAISEIATMIMNTVHWQELKQYTWVPIPTSKTKSDALYDDRLWRVLLKLRMHESENPLDIRELLLTKFSREAAHHRGAIRPKVDDHLDNLILNNQHKNPKPHNKIILFDDIITSGANFKAAQIILQKSFPNIPIIGIFVARNVKVDPSER